jgi:hypothetical protein
VKINELSVHKTKDTCIYFIAKNHFAENSVCESNCCGAKCTNLARGLVLTLGSRMECTCYYFLGTDSYWVAPMM